MTRVMLVTGATGLVGGSLVLELLRASDAEVVCLARPKGSKGAGERMRQALELACRLYGDQALVDDVRQRCSVLEGDVTLPGCGVSRAARRRIDEVWHSAALLAFDDDRENEVRLTNVIGSRHVLELAGDLGATTCNQLSTANERSKLEAEQIVAAAGFERTRIFRPSIVIGHSTTHAAAAATIPDRLVRDICGRIDGLRDRLARHSLRLNADPDARLDCVPVDEVARAAVGVSQSDSTELIFHLTSAAPRTLAEVLAVAAERAGIRPPTFVASADELTALDRRVDEQLARYRSFLGNAMKFDRTDAEGVP